MYTQQVNAKLTKHRHILRDQRHRTGNQRCQHKTKSDNSGTRSFDRGIFQQPLHRLQCTGTTWFWPGTRFTAAQPAAHQQRLGPSPPGDSARQRGCSGLGTAEHRSPTQEPNTGARPGPGTPGQMQQESPGAATTASIPYSPRRRRAGDDPRLQAPDGEPKGEAGER